MGFFNRFKKKDDRKPEPPAARSAPPAARPPDPEPAAMPAPSVKEMPVEELKAKLDRGETPLIIDVREPWEYDIVHLSRATLIPMNTIPDRMGELDKHAEIVVHCHLGARSWNVAAYMLQHGFTNVQNLMGGIDAWARRVDRTMKTY